MRSCNNDTDAYTFQAVGTSGELLVGVLGAASSFSLDSTYDALAPGISHNVVLLTIWIWCELQFGVGTGSRDVTNFTKEVYTSGS